MEKTCDMDKNKAYVVIINTSFLDNEESTIDSVHASRRSAEDRKIEIENGINLNEDEKFTFDWFKKHHSETSYYLVEIREFELIDK